MLRLWLVLAAVAVCGAAQAAEVVIVSPDRSSTVAVAVNEADRLVGNWSGKILGRKIGSMATLRVKLAAVGMPAGSTEYFLRTVRGYDNLACRGYLKLVEAAGTQYTFEESLTEPGRGFDGGCPISGRLVLTLRGDGVGTGEWITADGQRTVVQSGELTKQ